MHPCFHLHTPTRRAHAGAGAAAGQGACGVRGQLPQPCRRRAGGRAEGRGGGALARARRLQQQVSKGKVGAQGRTAVGVCRYLRGVELSKGYCPPGVPGSWAQARMYCGSSGADTLAERMALDALVVPALRRLFALVCLCVSGCIRVCPCAFAHASRVCNVPSSLCAPGIVLCACTACTIHQVRAWCMSSPPCPQEQYRWAHPAGLHHMHLQKTGARTPKCVRVHMRVHDRHAHAA